ncbi:hypothetical protein [Delftia tsuruhatensis]|uniref:Phage ABA sandwich domain-containing protein n=1 Tax=Delftia tsuruhatensis TaxID=180282 RepID=A0ABM6E4P1_9BURK|nr:hypothetical protein [Delftia tsuruhatensis]AOV02411.1 hypothetical protein BI380_14220 [Delftia tsuruhatensis]
MTIDHMIEAAAKASGVPIRRIDDGWEVRFEDMRGNDYEPNINGQQSFELAAALRISVEHNDPYDRHPWVCASVFCHGATADQKYLEDVPDESQRADRMRLAILRCAAAQAPKEQA